MTTLILTQKRLFSLRLTVMMDRLTERFLDWNHNGIITVFTLIFIAAAVISYLISAYTIFEIGFKIQEREYTISQLEALTASREISLHELRTGLANDSGELLNLMEKVSALKYIGGEGTVTASLPAMHP